MSVRWRIADIISPRRPFPALAALVVAVALLGCDCGKMDASSWFQSASVGDAVPVSVRFTLLNRMGSKFDPLQYGDDSDSDDDEDEDAQQELEPSVTTSVSQRHGIERHRARD